MTDKFNKDSSSDNINEFFSEFDQIDDEKSDKPEPVKTPPENSDVKPYTRATRGTSAANGSKTRATRGDDKTTKRSNRSKSKGRLEQASNSDKSKKGKGGYRVPKKKKKGPVRRALKIIGLLILIMIVAGCIYVGVVIAQAAPMAEKINYKNIYSYLNQRSTLYDDKGKVIENVFAAKGGNRARVDYKDLPENLVNGIVAIEDKTFWEHHGFNFVRMAGAVKESVFGSGQISGTSTITQQLARNVYLQNIKGQRSLSRKISEAYFAIVLEKELTKKQILEAYLNTIYLGFDSYGVEAASKSYFNKSVKKLDLLECASLCAIPKSPDSFGLVKSYDLGNKSIGKDDIITESDSMMYVFNGELSKPRRDMTIKNMVDFDYITQAEADEALSQDLRKSMKVTAGKSSGVSSYFSDFAIDQITEDLMEATGDTYEVARNLIYTGGLKIYTTMDKSMQKTIENAFKQNTGYPSVVNLRKDSDGNILAKNGKVLLYDYDDYLDSKGTFTLHPGEFKRNSDGGITIYKDKRLNLIRTEVGGAQDISIEFKPLYLYKDYHLYTIENGALSVPQGQKHFDAAGNCVISPDFVKKNKRFFKKKGKSLTIKKSNYVIKQEVIQPQSAMVIMDYKTGGVKAMVGGRNIKGKRLFNRAMEPRQPGSSIKPLAVYSAGLQQGVEKYKNGEPQNLSNTDGNNWGRYMTAGSVINDAPINGSNWPKNWYTGYRGKMTLRTAVQQSVNVAAVRAYRQMEYEFPVQQLEKMGVTTVVQEGATNDLNPAALALGGMTHGISPLEMAGAFGIFPGKGEYREPASYTKVLNADGKPFLESKDMRSGPKEVLDPGVAFIMTDILRTVVTQGTGKHASIPSQPVAGKTGTTSDKYDAWFVGFTPQYTAALWIGNDVNVQLSVGSEAAAGLWSVIMRQVCAGTAYGQFPSKPDNVNYIGGEYYVEGTYSNIPRPAGTGGSSSTTKEETTEKETTLPTTLPTTAPTTLPTTVPPTAPTTTTSPPTT